MTYETYTSFTHILNGVSVFRAELQYVDEHYRDVSSLWNAKWDLITIFWYSKINLSVQKTS